MMDDREFAEMLAEGRRRHAAQIEEDRQNAYWETEKTVAAHTNCDDTCIECFALCEKCGCVYEYALGCCNW
jgi:hypothetical protein